MHMIYGAPWLARIDRTGHSDAFLERVTPRQRLLLGEFETSTAPFHSTPLTYHPSEEEGKECVQNDGKKWDQFLNGATPIRSRL